MQLGYYLLNCMVSQSVRSSTANPNGSGFTLVLSGGPRVSIHFPYWWSPSCASLENPPSYIMRICLIIVTSLILQHLALELEMPHVGLLCLYASNKRTLMVLLILFFSAFNSSLILVLYCGVSTPAGSVGSELEHPMTLCLKNSIGYLNRELSVRFKLNFTSKTETRQYGCHFWPQAKCTHGLCQAGIDNMNLKLYEPSNGSRRIKSQIITFLLWKGKSNATDPVDDQ